MYVFDTSPLSALFKSFYRRRFPTLWNNFDQLVDRNSIVSTREVARELELYGNGVCQEWLARNRQVFTTPGTDEGRFVIDIYAVRNFQHNLEVKRIQKGGYNADPFVVAKAGVEHMTVVTLEQYSPHAARIPNICRHFGVPCMSLEEFMEAEGWQF